MKIVTILGARPQFVKAAALSREFKKHTEINELIVHTGQHFDKNMSEVFFEEMDIPKPHYNLNINGLGHGAMTGQMLEKLEELLVIEKPDFVLVYGDTNSTLAGALAASKLHIKVVHIEAGLRSFNMKMPEEINRILTDRISNLLFCPTETAINNLNNEGFDGFNCKIFNVGDVMQDAAMYYSANNSSKIINNLNLTDDFYLCTIHRPENTDAPDKLKEIFSALNIISKSVKVVIPIHPRTKKNIESLDIKTNPEIKLIEPVGYFDMIALLQNCKLILTDSGGLQKEAYFFRKFCITMRDQTEWVELVENGVSQVTSSNSSKIVESVKYYKNLKYPEVKDLYGGGNACKKIAEILLKATLPK